MVSDGLMLSGLYPLGVHAWRKLKGEPVGSMKSALAEWAMALAVSALRPAGFLPLPGANATGPRPIVMLHGYAMNRANFVVLARRLAAAGLGPIFGFEYWTLGRVAAGARQLGWFIDRVREATGADEVDIVGHSMGGVVARYYLTFGGGDRHVNRLITLGSPHFGTDVSAVSIGHASRELLARSQLITRLAASPMLQHARVTTILSESDVLVPASKQPSLAGAERIVYPDLGHVSLLGSRRVAAAIIERLTEPAQAATSTTQLGA
ncbi:MAG TPA: alpha/beta fold hydrolase [Kofleriaceae bacterium]|jgi:pimeloyl-ACP methyl ester carboxylesterase